MNQRELIERATKKTGLTASATKSVVQAVLGEIGSALQKGDAVRTTLGTFSVSKRAAHTGRNPATGEVIKIKASKSVKFRASRTIKDKLNKR